MDVLANDTEGEVSLPMVGTVGMEEEEAGATLCVQEDGALGPFMNG